MVLQLWSFVVDISMIDFLYKLAEMLKKRVTTRHSSDKYYICKTKEI